MRNFLRMFILSFLLLAVGCVNNNESINPKEQELKIGVVGHPPMVDEKNIAFTKIEIEKLSNASEMKIHALFIMPEFLEEASSAQYAKLYKSLKFPVFFIGSEKSYYPFTEEALTYAKAPSTNSGMFATGFINQNGQYKIFEYGFKNDKRTDENLKELYSNIFNTIVTEFVSKGTN